MNAPRWAPTSRTVWLARSKGRGPKRAQSQLLEGARGHQKVSRELASAVRVGTGEQSARLIIRRCSPRVVARRALIGGAVSKKLEQDEMIGGARAVFEGRREGGGEDGGGRLLVRRKVACNRGGGRGRNSGGNQEVIRR